MMALFERTLHCPARRRHVVIPCACLLLCLLVPPARAAELGELQVSESEGFYRIELAMQMQAPAQYVRRVLTDYEHIYRLDPAIVDSEILPSPEDGAVRVRTRIDDCIGFFCMKIDRVEDVRELEHGGLLATTVPTPGSFRSGFAEWQIRARGWRTEVIYQAQMEPDFFIPPVIGSYFIKQKLRKNTLASLARIECVARIQAGLEHPPEPEPVLRAQQPVSDHRLGDALLEGADPTRIARAPAAGGTVRGDADCARPCRQHDPACQP